MAAYKPRAEAALILSRAWSHIQEVDYNVTARWVFYRLLQDGTFHTKADYKKLLTLMSAARKRFYRSWRPWTLADDTRTATVRGRGFDSGQDWVDAVRRDEECSLDRWKSQPNYVEIWFEAAAMEGQFRHYANPNISLLAFKGDVSIPAKWEAAERIARQWIDNELPVKVLYYGDLDEKGLTIPETAERDVFAFVARYIFAYGFIPSTAEEQFRAFADGWEFIRVGLNEEQVTQYGIPENPERPGTYQWEGLDDTSAAELIALAGNYLDMEAFDEVEENEERITGQFRDHLDSLEIEEA